MPAPTRDRPYTNHERERTDETTFARTSDRDGTSAAAHRMGRTLTMGGTVPTDTEGTMQDPKKAIVEILSVIVELVHAKPMGLPKGELYAHLMPFGATLEHLDMITEVLVGSGRVKVRGNLILPA